MSQSPEQATISAGAETDSERFGNRLNSAVGKIASRMDNGALSTGDLAELRRVSPDSPFTPTLWKLLHELGEAESAGETSERRWATLFMGMAHCAGLHDYNTRLGEALQAAGWSEVRLTRLLEERDDRRLATHIRRMAQYLKSKQQPANWADVARLLFYQSGDYAQKIRLNIARSYYGAAYREEQEN